MGEHSSRVHAGAFVVAWLGVVAAVTVAAGRYEASYAAMNVELPLVTEWLVLGGRAIRGGVGALGALFLIGCGFSPAWIVPQGGALRRWFLLGCGQAFVFGFAAWGALGLPFHHLCVSLDESGSGSEMSEGSLVDQAFPFTAGVLVAVGLAQAQAWLTLSRDVLRLPGGGLGIEAVRALLVAVLPAVVLGVLGNVALDAAGFGGPGWLLVSPPIAAAGTTAVACFGVALGLRLRAADDGAHPVSPGGASGEGSRGLPGAS